MWFWSEISRMFLPVFGVDYLKTKKMCILYNLTEKDSFNVFFNLLQTYIVFGSLPCIREQYKPFQNRLYFSVLHELFSYENETLTELKCDAYVVKIKLY